ncbi:MAG: nitroreductase family protein [Acidimicrobiia bacterium]|nr:nitroreductase family protein [Acidimicrobiia bacterium]
MHSIAEKQEFTLELSEILKKRRMVRNYTDEPVDRGAIERIVQTGRRAPSAGFTQGQSFVVVTDPSIRAEIAKLAGEPDYVEAGFDPWISRAPVHVIVCINEQDYHRRYREHDKAPDGDMLWPVPYWWVDAGASMMLVLLAAVEEGLAAGFLGVHSIPDLKALLAIPDEVEPIGVITIGHPAPDRKSGSLKRGWRPDTEIKHWQRWNSPGEGE